MAVTTMIDPPGALKQLATPKSGASVSGSNLRDLDAQQRFLSASWKYAPFVSSLSAKNVGVSETILNSGDKDSWLVWIPPFTSFVKLHVLSKLRSGKNDGAVYVQRVGIGLTGTNNDYQKKIDIWSDDLGYYATDTALSTADDAPGEHASMTVNRSGTRNKPDGDWVLARFDVWLDDVELFGIVFEPLRANAVDLDW